MKLIRLFFFASIVALIFMSGLVLGRLSQSNRTTPLVHVENHATAAPSSKTSQVKPESTSTFKWSQIESEDYNVYVNNLRAIGCPEVTIRRIVTAELTENYSKSSPADSARQIQSGIDSDISKSEISKSMPGAVAEAVSAIFHETPVSNQAPMRTPAQVRKERLADQPASYPLAFRATPQVSSSAVTNTHALGNSPAPNTVGNQPSGSTEGTAATAAAVDQIKKDFVQQLGETTQNPADPIYHKKWISAQSIADQRLRALVGYQAFNAYSASSSQTSQP